MDIQIYKIQDIIRGYTKYDYNDYVLIEKGKVFNNRCVILEFEEDEYFIINNLSVSTQQAILNQKYYYEKE